MAKTINPIDYHKVLRSLLKPYLNSYQVIDDAVQEVLIRLWKAEQRGVEVNYGYMIKSAQNYALTVIHSYYTRKIKPLGILPDKGRTEHPGYKRVLAKQLFAQLSPNDKDLIAKRAMGYKFKEIGSSAKQRYQYYVRTKCLKS